MCYVLDTKDNATDTLGIVCCALYTLYTADLLDVAHTLGALDNTPVALEVENKSAGAVGTANILGTLDTVCDVLKTPVIAFATMCDVTETPNTLLDSVIGALDIYNAVVIAGIVCAKDTTDA